MKQFLQIRSEIAKIKDCIVISSFDYFIFHISIFSTAESLLKSLNINLMSVFIH